MEDEGLGILGHDNDWESREESDEASTTASGTPPAFNPFALLHYKGDLLYSLALSKTTPCFARYSLSIFMLLAHAMFMYGQVFPMWRLYYHVDANITLTADSLESEALFSALGLENPLHVYANEGKDLDTFTYGFAVKQLWEAKNLHQEFGPKFAAVVLVLFSGIWPHIKLLLLHNYWLVPHSEVVRTTSFYWLSTFGKWSLADVFVVCVMIGVINLDLSLDPDKVVHSLRGEIPRTVEILKENISLKQAQHIVCEKALKYQCDSWFDIKCEACRSAVRVAYKNPSILESVADDMLRGIKTNGHGSLQLRIAGLSGIYIFCIAVVISLLLSFVIDTFNHRAKARNARRRRGRAPRGTLGVTGSPGTVCLENSESGLSLSNLQEAPMFSTHGSSTSLLTLKDEPGPVLLTRRVSRRVWSRRSYFYLCALAFLALGFVLWGILTNSMERRVLGSLPELANILLGVEWARGYSLWDLTGVVGASGGFDLILMGTFALFCVVGPILRAIVCIIYLIFPASKQQHKRSMVIIDLLGSFCAWEVFLVALFLVDMEMPPITSTIVTDSDTPICGVLRRAGLEVFCFKVEFDILTQFIIVVMAGSLLMFVATLAVKLGFKGLDPYHDGDLGGPYCCEACPPLLIDFNRDVRLDSMTAESQPLLNHPA